MPAPYLDVPLWPSIEDELMQQADAGVHQLWSECYDMCDNMAGFFDKKEPAFRVEDLSRLERIHNDLRQIGYNLKPYGYISDH